MVDEKTPILRLMMPAPRIGSINDGGILSTFT